MIAYAMIAILAGLSSVPLSWYALRPKAAPDVADPLVEAVILSLTVSPERWQRVRGAWNPGTEKWDSWTMLRCELDGVSVVYEGNGEWPTKIASPAYVRLSQTQAYRCEMAWRSACADQISSSSLSLAPAKGATKCLTT